MLDHLALQCAGVGAAADCHPRVFAYHPAYHGVFLRDPDGNDVEAVHHGFPSS